MQTNLYIVRHGEAICNVERFVGGETGCQGLTERGHAQVERLAQWLARGKLKVDVLYASTFRRARETAQPLAEALNLPVQWDDDLQEHRPGEADGLAGSEAEERYGHIPLTDPYRAAAPGSESVAGFLVRAGTALDRIVREHQGQTVMVVAHGGVVDASFHLFLGLGAYTLAHAGFYTFHTSLTQWRTEVPDRPGEIQRWLLMRYNDVTHLADFGPSY